MKNIGIIDYDCGNLFSLGNALKKIEKEFDIVTNPRHLSRYDLVILPGVGSFGPAANHLIKIGFASELYEFNSKKKEIVGICLGMQLLLSESYELGVNPGLGFIKGSVRKITQSNPQVRIPNIGWSALRRNSSFKGEGHDKVEQFTGKHFYFVHSYHACPDNSEQISLFVSFGDDKLAAMICSDNLTGVQFHPEISGADGLKLLSAIVDR
jgi:imidazole glycerol-phosphate synthase subunit HisH